MMMEGRDVGPGHRLARLAVDDIGGEEGEARLGRPGLERAPCIVARLDRRGSRTGRAEIEFVVADRSRGVAHDVVGANHGRAFFQIRFQRALKHVACVDLDKREEVPHFLLSRGKGNPTSPVALHPSARPSLTIVSISAHVRKGAFSVPLGSLIAFRSISP